MNNDSKTVALTDGNNNIVVFTAARAGWVTMQNSRGEKASMLRAEAAGRIATLVAAGWSTETA
jgi:hypothetical protein